MGGLARRFGGVYTRYADDLTVSGDEAVAADLRRFLRYTKRIVTAEGFRLNPGKLRILRQDSRQIVTGVVVNRRVNASRGQYDHMKAIVHNARQAGCLSSQNRDGRPDFREYLMGKAAHIRSLSRERGDRLLAGIRGLPD